MIDRYKNELENGQNVSMKIDLKYPSGSDVRPSNFTVKATINGEDKTWRFEQ